MGFTAQMISWDEEFCAMLVAGDRAAGGRGRFVVRFDNRDCGLSTKLDGVAVDLGVVMGALAANDPDAVQAIAPYSLSDMAADALAVLDAVGVERAHVVGASMGGMIAQTLAIEFAHRVASMTSIMSTTGEVEVGQASPEAMAALLTPAPTDRAGYLDHAVRSWPMLQSPRYTDAERNRTRAAAGYDRSFYPEGSSRQLTAVIAGGSRAELLPMITIPTLVIHGRVDPLIGVSGGIRTAELVPGVDLLVLGDMGHDQPQALWPKLCAAIVTHTT